MNVLVWLKRDLRLHDHPALSFAAGLGPVLPLYIVEPSLWSGPDASARLLYIPGGVAVPDHGHRGMELTLVLQGAFADSTARFARGDIEIADEALEHTPVAEAGAPCICLAATDAPLRFKTMLPRIAQSVFRI